MVEYWPCKQFEVDLLEQYARGQGLLSAAGPQSQFNGIVCSPKGTKPKAFVKLGPRMQATTVTYCDSNNKELGLVRKQHKSRLGRELLMLKKKL